MRRGFRQDERGISVVVGAMMIFAIVITIVASVRATVVPNMEADAEASHMRALSQQLVGLRADVQRQIELESSSALSHSLQMGRQKVGVFDGGQIADKIGLVFPNELIKVWGDKVLVEDPSSGASETWSTPPPGPVENVKDVNSLRLKLDQVSKGNSGGAATLNVFDKDNKWKGCLRVRVDDLASTDYYIFYETYAYEGTLTDCPLPPSSPSTAQAGLVNRVSEAFHQSHTFAPYYVDALDPNYRFDRVIQAATPPLKLSLALTPLKLSGMYAMSYVAYTATGPGVPVGGGGVSESNYERPFAGGYLEYEARNRHFTSQIYRLEHGALILSQPKGEVMRVAPDIRIDQIATPTGALTGIVATIPSLSGEARTISSQGTAVVRSSLVSTTDVSISTNQLRIELDTQHKALWRAFFEQRLQAAGLQWNPLPELRQYEVGDLASGKGVYVHIWGTTVTDAPLLPTTYDVRLVLQHANLDIKLNP